MKGRTEMLELAERLLGWSEYELSELGEACTALINMADNSSFVSDKFNKALAKEMERMIAYFEANFTLEEKTVTEKRTYYTLQEK